MGALRFTSAQCTALFELAHVNTVCLLMISLLLMLMMFQVLTAQILLSAGADFRARDNDYRTPLDLAARKTYPGMSNRILTKVRMFTEFRGFDRHVVGVVQGAASDLNTTLTGHDATTT